MLFQRIKKNDNNLTLLSGSGHWTECKSIQSPLQPTKSCRIYY